MKRVNPWLFERDGDLNPTWPLVVLFCLIGLLAVVAALVSGQQWAIVAALSYLGSITVALLISALPRDKAKILARSRAPGEIAKAIASAGREYGTSTAWFDDEL